MCSVLPLRNNTTTQNIILYSEHIPRKGKEGKEEGGREEKGKERQEEREEDLSAGEHHLQVMTVCWGRQWQPTPVFPPGGSQGRGAWWAAVYGVTQSRTRLKRLSSSSTIKAEIEIFLKVNWAEQR